MAKKPFNYWQLERDKFKFSKWIPAVPATGLHGGRARRLNIDKYPDIEVKPSPGIAAIQAALHPNIEEMEEHHEREMALYKKERGLL